MTCYGFCEIQKSGDRSNNHNLPVQFWWSEIVTWEPYGYHRNACVVSIVFKFQYGISGEMIRKSTAYWNPLIFHAFPKQVDFPFHQIFFSMAILPF